MAKKSMIAREKKREALVKNTQQSVPR
jgi:hypothetical protein